MSATQKFVRRAEELSLATSGTIARYHRLLERPFEQPLLAHGYIIGIEKSPRTRVGFPGMLEDKARLQPPLPRAGLSAIDLKNQRRSFEASMDDPKVMFVSHILRYGAMAGQIGTQISQVHSAYTATAFGTHDAGPLRQSYEAGWAALDRLEAQVIADVAEAEAAGTPFTHIAYACMGWNNDQMEAIARYNAVIQNTQRAARAAGAAFNPLVIGLTWPSVWGGTSPLDLANRALHIGSYATKAHDADEIGFGLGGHIANAMLPRIEAATGLQSVYIGHSMGARILTRAYYSADILRGAVARSGPKPLVIGLQAAFSANRFLEDYRLIPIVRAIFPAEGGPYQDHAAPGGDVVLTWSRHDKANPVARFATGARHVGGKAGADAIADAPRLAARFETLALPGDVPRDPLRAACAAVQGNDRVLYIDASAFVESHGDIGTPATGQMVCELIEGLGA
ncbi:MAG: hypothetical protein AAF744_00785 [Pseudomonadota bacterium]